MNGRIYDEILQMILREVGRLNAQVNTTVIQGKLEDLTASPSNDESSNSSSSDNNSNESLLDDAIGWTSSKRRGGMEYEVNPYFMRPFEDFDYALYYNDSEELTHFTSNNSAVDYELIKDDYEDLILIKVTAPKKIFYVGLIYENYDVRVSLLPYVRKKGKLVEVVILDEDLKEVPIALEVDPKEQVVALNDIAYVTATAIYSNGRRELVTTTCNWTIDSPCNINNGTITNTVSPGVFNITAEYKGVSDNAIIRILDWNIIVKPDTQTININETARYNAIIHFEDNTEKDITDIATWGINKYSINKGLVTNTTTTGTATLYASYKGKIDYAELIVKAPQPNLLRLEIVPAYSKVNLNDTVQLTAYKVYDDGTREILYGGTWSIDKYRINQNGFVDNTTTAGTATPRVDWNGLYATARIDVLDPFASINIIIVPGYKSIKVNETAQFRVFKVYPDGHQEEIINDSNLVFTVKRSGGVSSNCVINQSGLVTNTTVPESVIVTATWRGKTVNANLDILNIPEFIFYVEPYSATYYIGQTVTVQAYRKYENGTIEEKTTSANWSISPSSYNSISKGKFVPLASGTYLVTAIDDMDPTKQDVAVIDVISPTDGVTKIIIKPSSATINIGESRLFMAYKVLTDGTEVDITNEANWSIDKYSINKGNVTNTTTAGTATITATWYGLLAQATLTVVDPNATPEFVYKILPENNVFRRDVGTGYTPTYDYNLYKVYGNYEKIELVPDSSSYSWEVVEVPGQGIPNSTITNTGFLTVNDWGPMYFKIQVRKDGNVVASTYVYVDDDIMPKWTFVEPDRLDQWPVGTPIDLTSRTYYSNGNTSNTTYIDHWRIYDSNGNLVSTDRNFTPTVPGQYTVYIQSAVSADEEIYTFTAFSDSSGGSTPPPSSQPTPTYIEIIPGTQQVLQGNNVIFLAVLHYDDGTIKDITSDGTWSVIGTTEIRNNNDGSFYVYTTCPTGTYPIRCDYNSLYGVGGIEVVSKLLSGLKFVWGDGTNYAKVETPKTFKVYAQYSDGTEQDISMDPNLSISGLTYSQSNGNVIVSSNTSGQKNFTASYKGVSKSAWFYFVNDMFNTSYSSITSTLQDWGGVKDDKITLSINNSVVFQGLVNATTSKTVSLNPGYNLVSFIVNDNPEGQFTVTISLRDSNQYFINGLNLSSYVMYPGDEYSVTVRKV